MTEGLSEPMTLDLKKPTANNLLKEINSRGLRSEINFGD
jgi:hypothetical protein